MIININSSNSTTDMSTCITTTNIQKAMQNDSQPKGVHNRGMAAKWE